MGTLVRLDGIFVHTFGNTGRIFFVVTHISDDSASDGIEVIETSDRKLQDRLLDMPVYRLEKDKRYIVGIPAIDAELLWVLPWVQPDHVALFKYNIFFM